METLNYRDLGIIVTLPQDIEWLDYQKELLGAASGETLNFKVGSFPSKVGPGARCYLTHRGYIKGYHIISGFSEKEFVCTTTGKRWTGRFIERTGRFHYIEEKIPYKGFQGWRYFNMTVYLESLREHSPD